MPDRPSAADRRRDDDFASIMAGLGDAVAIAEGTAVPGTYKVHAPERVDVRAIRKGLGLTQAAFAARFGLPKGTIEDWEQKRREPDTGSRILLKVIEREPEAVQRALA